MTDPGSRKSGRWRGAWAPEHPSASTLTLEASGGTKPAPGQAPLIFSPHRQPTQCPLPGTKTPARTHPPQPFLSQLKPTHRLSRRFLLVHRQGPGVGGHSPQRQRDAAAGGRAGGPGAIAGSGGSQQARVRPLREGRLSLPRWAPEAARRSDVGAGTRRLRSPLGWWL